MKPSFLKNPLKIKKQPSSSFSNVSEWINSHNLAILHYIKNSKRHFIPHVILVQVIYKRSHANKMTTKRCCNEDGLPGKEGVGLHRFIYGAFFNI